MVASQESRAKSQDKNLPITNFWLIIKCDLFFLALGS